MTLRLPSEYAKALDKLVRDGRFRDRSSAVRAAIARLLALEYERELAEEFRRAYARQPATEEERAEPAAAMALTAERIRDEERG